MKELNITEEKIFQIHQIMKHPLFTPFPRQFEDSYNFGWARGTVFYCDTVLDGNWYKWFSIIGKGDFKSGDPVPEVKISATRSPEVIKMLEKAFSSLQRISLGVFEFLEWIGFALGLSWFKKPNIPEREWKYLYETVDFSLFLQYPADYLSYFLAEHGQSGALSYYPTPSQVSIMIMKMLEIDEEQALISSTFEPCIGAGSMILPSRSLNCVGADLSNIMVRAAAIQMFFYKPSMLYVPNPIIGLHFDREEQRINKYFEFNSDTRIYVGDSLKGEYEAPINIFKENSEFTEVYVHPIDLEKRELYKYDDDLSLPWESLTKIKRFEIVKAMAREINFDSSVTNPPFNLKLSEFEKKSFEEIRIRNEKFLANRTQKKCHSIFEFIEEEVNEKIEIGLTNKNTKKSVAQNQLMFTF